MLDRRFDADGSGTLSYEELTAMQEAQVGWARALMPGSSLVFLCAVIGLNKYGNPVPHLARRRRRRQQRASWSGKAARK